MCLNTHNAHDTGIEEELSNSMYPLLILLIVDRRLLDGSNFQVCLGVWTASNSYKVLLVCNTSVT